MQNPTHRILVVEDEAVARDKLSAYLQKENLAVFEAETLDKARSVLNDNDIDVVLLDINLPDGSGIDLARDLRAKSDIGIILVTVRDDDIDRIIGIEIGADDYITKPYHPRELLARIKGLLRRTDQIKEIRTKGDVTQYRFGKWTLDILRRQISSATQEPAKLSRGEFELLRTLVSRPGRVLSRDFLLDQVTHRCWAPNDRSIDVLIGRLRQKIEENSKHPELILTAHGEGYLFAEKVETVKTI